MKYTELDTPSLLIDKAILESNLRFMQNYANAICVSNIANRDISM